jgi:hypothetical protein
LLRACAIGFGKSAPFPFFEPRSPTKTSRHAGAIQSLWNLYDVTRRGEEMDLAEQPSYV